VGELATTLVKATLALHDEPPAPERPAPAASVTSATATVTAIRFISSSLATQNPEQRLPLT
jgi:hypothetical protein